MKKTNLEIALHNFEESLGILISCWDEYITRNENNDIHVEEYPFEEDIDEVYSKVVLWVEAKTKAIRTYQRGGVDTDKLEYVEGDGVDYEIWRHKETKEEYKVPISIERDFSNLEKVQ